MSAIGTIESRNCGLYLSPRNLSHFGKLIQPDEFASERFRDEDRWCMTNFDAYFLSTLFSDLKIEFYAGGYCIFCPKSQIFQLLTTSKLKFRLITRIPKKINDIKEYFTISWKVYRVVYEENVKQTIQSLQSENRLLKKRLVTLEPQVCNSSVRRNDDYDYDQADADLKHKKKQAKLSLRSETMDK